jgi:uncharacterized membrane protein YbaN (DUF454 family)
MEKQNSLIRLLLLILGLIFTALGVIGIFLPILPTIPFLLLAAACFIRSSQRFYRWLMENRFFGAYLKNYHEGKGISLRGKIVSILLLWGAISFSAYQVNNIWVRILLAVIAIGVTIHLVVVPTHRDDSTGKS